MSTEALLTVGREALLLMVLASMPPVLAGLVVGVGMGLLQAVTQVQEPTLSVVPRLCAALLALAVAFPWIGGQLLRFTAASLVFRGVGPVTRLLADVAAAVRPELLAWAVASMRVLPVTLLCPVLGGQLVPAPVRLAVAGTLGLALQAPRLRRTGGRVRGPRAVWPRGGRGAPRGDGGSPSVRWRALWGDG